MANTKTVTSVRVTADVLLREGMIACFSGTSEATSANSGLLHKVSNVQDELYQAIIGGVKYTWNVAGECLNSDDATHHLYIMDTTLISTPGGGTTRGVGGGTVTINDLNARDGFAIAALEALINKHPDPIDCDSTVVTFLANKAYDYANAMLLASANARATDSSSSSSGDSAGTVAVDASSLSNNTEKLLNNIHKAIEATKTEQANIVTKLGSTLKIDNPNNDKFEIEGGGNGGGVSYEDIPLLTETGQTTMSHVLGFATDSESNKYLGKLTLATFCNKVWDAVKTKIWTYIKSSVDTEITSQGSSNLGSGGSWRSTVESIVDSRITEKVKSDSLK